MSTLWQEIIDDTATLVRRAAGSRGVLQLSPELVARLERLVPAATSAPAASDTPGAPDPAPVSAAETTAAAASMPVETAPVAEIGADDLPALAALVSACERCGLCATRTQTVFGVGNPNADLVFVGEAPGFYEDKQGEPFVGKAGQLLTDIIVKGMKLQREDVYICNVLKCRPPENRDPNPMEVEQCEPYLLRQLELIRPKAICALGGVAAKTLLRTEDSVGKLRGIWHDYHGIPLRVTYHPAYLLRTPADKKKTWEDIQEVMRKLAE